MADINTHSSIGMLTGKVIIITGAAKCLSAAQSRACAIQGAQLVIASVVKDLSNMAEALGGSIARGWQGLVRYRVIVPV